MDETNIARRLEAQDRLLHAILAAPAPLDTGEEAAERARAAVERIEAEADYERERAWAWALWGLTDIWGLPLR